MNINELQYFICNEWVSADQPIYSKSECEIKKGGRRVNGDRRKKNIQVSVERRQKDRRVNGERREKDRIVAMELPFLNNKWSELQKILVELVET